ncbi:MAG: hypothetical protein GC168_02425 [Candidatus Hydrogenedens sp.]|nr:hypothetical protein [Candidatus Hydrogenedens sp.]
MRCVCGFNFALFLADGGELESYAVVSDAKYQKFLKREMKVLEAPEGSKKKYRRLFKSSQLIGSLQRCPECGSYRLLLPEEGGVVHLEAVCNQPEPCGHS